MKRFISFSGGVESRTMAMLYGRGATLLFCDTGAEHSELYEKTERFIDFIKEWHKGNIEVVKLIGTAKHKGKQLNGLIEYIKESTMFPSQQMRFCTRMFKVELIDKYLKDKGNCKLMIGFNADEENRTGNMEALNNVVYDYPLIRAGWDREDCENFLKHHGQFPEFPAYMTRGGCKMCFFKSVKEYKAMYYINPEEFAEVRELEESLQDRRTKMYAIHSSGKTMKQIQTECESEIPFDFNEIYKNAKQETSCGAFCMR